MSAPAHAGRRSSRPSGRTASTAWSRTKIVASAQPSVSARSGPRRAPFVLLVAGLLIGGLCALLALNTAAAAEELRRHALAQSNADLTDDVQQARADLAASQAPAALASAAARLGMVPAGGPAFLSLQPDGKATVLGEPQPATTPAPPPARTSTPPRTTTTPKPSATPSHARASRPATTKPPTSTAPITKPPVTPTRTTGDGR